MSLLRTGSFLSFCLHQLKIFDIWKRALLVAISKPIKQVKDPKNYRPIYLLCVRYKTFKYFIYIHIEPVIDPLFLGEQVGFQRRTSTVY